MPRQSRTRDDSASSGVARRVRREKDKEREKEKRHKERKAEREKQKERKREEGAGKGDQREKVVKAKRSTRGSLERVSVRVKEPVRRHQASDSDRSGGRRAAPQRPPSASTSPEPRKEQRKSKRRHLEGEENEPVVYGPEQPPTFGPERPVLGPERPVMGPEKPMLVGPEKPMMGPEKPILGLQKHIGAAPPAKRADPYAGLAIHNAVQTGDLEKQAMDRNMSLWTGRDKAVVGAGGGIEEQSGGFRGARPMVVDSSFKSPFARNRNARKR